MDFAGLASLVAAVVAAVAAVSAWVQRFRERRRSADVDQIKVVQEAQRETIDGLVTENARLREDNVDLRVQVTRLRTEINELRRRHL